MFAPLAKWAAEISDTSRIPEYVARAAHTALSGRPGPVVLSLPEDMLSAQIDIANVPVSPVAQAHPGDKDMAAIAEALKNARQPIIIAGGPGWSKQVRDDVTAFAESWNLPVTAMFRGQDCMDNRHPNYAGHTGLGIDPALGKRVREADVILAMGPRLGEMTTSGYTLLTPPDPKQKLIHVHPGAEELGSVYRADIPVQSSLSTFAARLAVLKPPKSIPWSDWTKGARTDYEAFCVPQDTPGDVKLAQIISHVSNTLPDDAIIANGAGNYTGFVHRYTQYKGYGSQLANTAGSMGYCLPAAIAGQLAAPSRKVVCYAGDGCFLMNGQELSTAVRYELPIIIIVVNNDMYGTIRMHQEREYPNRVSGTDLHNPDFAAYARSFGANGETVLKTEDFADIFDAALNSSKPTLIELKIDPEAITPAKTLSEIRGTSS
jgi:acetolactate synthase-1/2/3 large subunit